MGKQSINGTSASKPKALKCVIRSSKTIKLTDWIKSTGIIFVVIQIDGKASFCDDLHNWSIDLCSGVLLRLEWNKPEHDPLMSTGTGWGEVGRNMAGKAFGWFSKRRPPRSIIPKVLYLRSISLRILPIGHVGFLIFHFFFISGRIMSFCVSLAHCKFYVVLDWSMLQFCFV